MITVMKVSKYKKDLCLTEKLVLQNPLLFLHYTISTNIYSELLSLHIHKK